MAAVRPYLLTDQNHFEADISRHWEEFVCKVSTKFLQWFQRRCNNGENQKWLPAIKFADGTEPFSGMLREYLRQVWKISDQWSRRRCDNEIVTVLSNWHLAILKMAVVRHICWRTRIDFRRTHLDIERNSYARFRQNSSSGFRGDSITVEIKDGCRRPHLSTDRNNFRACTTRLLGKHLRQV